MERWPLPEASEQRGRPRLWSVHGPRARVGAPGCRGHAVGPCLPSCSPAESPGAVEDVSFPHRVPTAAFQGCVLFSLKEVQGTQKSRSRIASI